MILLALFLSFSDTLVVANKLYNDGNYESAMEKYEYLTDSGIRNHIIYYNLGNCYFKIGKLGKTILFYKRAQKLRPNDSDINFNLDFVRARRVDEVKTSQLPKIVISFLNLLKYPSINILSIITTFLYFGLASIICLSLFGKMKLTPTLKIALPIALVLTLTIFWGNLTRINKQEGVLLDKIAEVRSGPSEDYTLIFTIHEGMEIKVLECQGEWAKIVLPNGFEGWLKTNQIGKV